MCYSHLVAQMITKEPTNPMMPKCYVSGTPWNVMGKQSLSYCYHKVIHVTTNTRYANRDKYPLSSVPKPGKKGLCVGFIGSNTIPFILHHS